LKPKTSYWVLLFIVWWGLRPVTAQNSFELPEEAVLLWEQAIAQPDDFAVACMPLDDPEQMTAYNAEEAFPLASVSKLLIFIEYAARLETSQIQLGEAVRVEELERYNLPRTDRGAHDRFMEQYSPDKSSISLWDVSFDGMMQYSSNAASDYVLERLDPVDWEEMYSRLDLRHTSIPHPLTMIPLLMNNHETGMATMDDVAELSAEQGLAYFERYMDDGAWRREELAYRTERRRSFPAWPIQAAILQQHTAVGSVSDFMNVLTLIYTDAGVLPPNVSYLVRNALRWRENNFINTNYVEFGSKLGFYSGGLIALVAYGLPAGGQPIISVTFMRNIPQSTYSDMLREDSVGEFAHWLNFNACAGLEHLIAELS
jgi:D-alanyl-D-alanine carboxypeptidase